jgi:hypothetical protein
MQERFQHVLKHCDDLEYTEICLETNEARKDLDLSPLRVEFCRLVSRGEAIIGGSFSIKCMTALAHALNTLKAFAAAVR